MKKQNTLISILIINYNNHSLLKRSIESCLKQSYKNIEILIFDDQSDDSSPNVLACTGVVENLSERCGDTRGLF